MAETTTTTTNNNKISNNNNNNNITTTNTTTDGQHHELTRETWGSWLELLTPMEVFVTVDSFPVWRRHLAWAKPDGKELRDILTLRFSSTMVLLSLLLGTEMGVLFNPNETTRAVREAMAAEAYGDFKFWIGVTIWISACVTVIGLVGTFAAWGMVSSISAENAHCLLRSTIGQHVASQPAHFVVAALYLFFLWLLMFLVEMLRGPLCLVLLCMAAVLFFQVIVPLSAFGRLIMHTGAMSSKQVLEPELERCLLPSGLHAGLLIKATRRQRKRISVLSQYRTPSIVRRQPAAVNATVTTAAAHPNDDKDDIETASSNKNATYGSLLSTTTTTNTAKHNHHHHHVVRGMSKNRRKNSVQDVLPRPSILNSMHTSNFRAVVDRVLASKSQSFDSSDDDDDYDYDNTDEENVDWHRGPTTIQHTEGGIVPATREEDHHHHGTGGGENDELHKRRQASDGLLPPATGSRRPSSSSSAEAAAAAGLNPRSSMVLPLSAIQERDSVASGLDLPLDDDDDNNAIQTFDSRRSLVVRPSMTTISNTATTSHNTDEAPPAAAAAESEEVRSSPTHHAQQQQQQRHHHHHHHQHRRVSGLRASMTSLIRGQLRRSSRMQTEHEWHEEFEVRELYDLPPPAQLEEPNYHDDDDMETEDQFNAMYSTITTNNNNNSRRRVSFLGGDDDDDGGDGSGFFPRLSFLRRYDSDEHSAPAAAASSSTSLLSASHEAPADIGENRSLLPEK